MVATSTIRPAGTWLPVLDDHCSVVEELLFDEHQAQHVTFYIITMGNCPEEHKIRMIKHQ